MDWTPSERSSAALPLASRGCKVITGEPAMTDEENPLLNSAKVELSEDLMEGPLICPASKKKKNDTMLLYTSNTKTAIISRYVRFHRVVHATFHSNFHWFHLHMILYSSLVLYCLLNRITFYPSHATFSFVNDHLSLIACEIYWNWNSLYYSRLYHCEKFCCLLLRNEFHWKPESVLWQYLGQQRVAAS